MHEVGECYAGCFVPGCEVVVEFGCDLEGEGVGSGGFGEGERGVQLVVDDWFCGGGGWMDGVGGFFGFTRN